MLIDVTSHLSSASNHLPQTLGKSTRPQHGTTKVSQLHLPPLPNRHNIKHLSALVTRANRDNAPRQPPGLGREGGTGRREAVTVISRDVPKVTSRDVHLTPNNHFTRQSANPRSVTTTHAKSTITTTRKLVPPHTLGSTVS